MFVVCFGDGLGNQMFQYAFYLSLIDNYPDNKVLMDINNIYGKSMHNGFELERIFGIKKDECSFGTAVSLSDYYPKQKKRYLFMNALMLFRRRVFGSKSSFIKEDDPTAFYEDVYNLSRIKSYIFVGNWVNEKYLMRVEKKLKDVFLFPDFDENDVKNREFADVITNCNAVGVHVRLGDYKFSSMYSLTEDYYVKAKREIEKRVKEPKYIIFSDEPEETESVKKIFGECVVISGNAGNNSFRDMQLMSLCKHNIIANSTFSFWGAYLNNHNDKVVVAPSKVHADMKYPFACKEWVVVDVDENDIA